ALHHGWGRRVTRRQGSQGRPFPAGTAAYGAADPAGAREIAAQEHEKPAQPRQARHRAGDRMLKIPPDSTFLVQMLVFAVLFFVLRRWWFEPVLWVIEERQRRSEGAVAEARAMEAEVVRLRAEHEAALVETRARARQEFEDMLRRAETEQVRIVDEATAEAQRALAGGRGGLADEVAEARKGLEAQVQSISRDVARMILGRAV